MICMRIGEPRIRFVETSYGAVISSQRKDLDGRWAEKQNQYLVFNDPAKRTRLELGILD